MRPAVGRGPPPSASTECAAAALIIAFLAPLLGVVADHFASRKTIMLMLTLIASLAASALWWVTPDVDAALLALIVSAIVIVASELSFVAYNALLPQLAERSVIGRVSGVAWGMGYFGAIICLVLMLAATRSLVVGRWEAPWGLASDWPPD